MNFEEIVKLGEVLELNFQDLCLKTKLLEMNEQRRFTVFHPTLKGAPIPLSEGDLLQATFYRESGVYEFKARVITWFKRGNLNLCMLEAISEVVKFQRRQSFRLPIALKVTLWQADDKSGNQKKYKAKTVDISEHGMLLTCFECFDKGTLINAEVHINSIESRVFQAEVLRCERPFGQNDPQKTVLLFVNCSEADRRYLGRFIMQQQIMARKKRSFRK